VLGDENRAAVLFREFAAGIEPHAERGDVRAELLRRRRELLARRLAPNCGSATSPPWQYGKPKSMPALGAWLSSSGGTSLPRLSRPLSVNQSSRVAGSQSKPTLFLTPRAKTSRFPPAASRRLIVPYSPFGSHTLHGAPMPT
jgi:hypothetical protein